MTQEVAGATAARGSTTTIRRTTARSTRMMTVEQESKGNIHPAFAGVMIVTSIALLYTCFFWWDIVRGDEGPSSATEGLAGWANRTFVAEEK